MRSQAGQRTSAFQGLQTQIIPYEQTTTRHTIPALNYLCPYSIRLLILLFFAASVLGWVWEVGFHYLTAGDFVNRGILHGPWLPIYGVGATLSVTLLYRLRTKPMLEFFSAIVLAGVVEYLTSYLLERASGLRWWDYSDYFLNLNGRICAGGLLLFGVGAVLVVYLLVPGLEYLLRKVPQKLLLLLCVTLLLTFSADLAYSHAQPNTGTGITTIVTAGENAKL